ncbi:MAG: DUF4118 domain-containing protein [Saprospiraceae bacterium]|nr:DUF4118 domain-containing protein [Saprospiraceae bacterium]
MGSNIRQVSVAIAAVLLTALGCYPIANFIGYRSVALILLLVVSVLAMRMGLWAVLISAGFSALIWDFFFIPPFFTFTIGAAEDMLLMVMYFIVALLNAVINYRVRQFEQVKLQKEERENTLKLYNTLFNALSHDLRTPVAAILVASDTLQDYNLSLSKRQQRELLAEITSGAIRLSEQVENLLNMSRIEAGVIQAKKEWCDVSDLTYGVVERHDRDAGRIVVSVSEDMPFVYLDFGLTTHALHNLVSNALRHTPPEAEIEVSAELLEDLSGHFEDTFTSGREENLKSVVDTKTSRLILKVKDNGRGFPPEEINTAFDKFFRYDYTRFDGIGLGLCIVKGFTEAQGGEVSIRNRDEGGAECTLEFPTRVLKKG